MDRKTALFFLIVLALLVLPGLAGEVPDAIVNKTAAYGMAAYVVALIASIFGALDRIINGSRRERKEP